MKPLTPQEKLQAKTNYKDLTLLITDTMGAIDELGQWYVGRMGDKKDFDEAFRTISDRLDIDELKDLMVTPAGTIAVGLIFRVLVENMLNDLNRFSTENLND